MRTKICGKCGEELPLSSFHRKRSHITGRAWSCRSCASQRTRRAANQPSRSALSAEKRATSAANTTKVCTGCGNERPYADYYADCSRCDGMFAKCKVCCAAYSASRYQPRGRRISSVPLAVRKHARNVLNNAVYAGLVKRGRCEVCGAKRAQGHHDDYSKPLSVRWLCVFHHAEHHRINGWPTSQ